MNFAGIHPDRNQSSSQSRPFHLTHTHTQTDVCVFLCVGIELSLMREDLLTAPSHYPQCSPSVSQSTRCPSTLRWSVDVLTDRGVQSAAWTESRRPLTTEWPVPTGTGQRRAETGSVTHHVSNELNLSSASVILQELPGFEAHQAPMEPGSRFYVKQCGQ